MSDVNVIAAVWVPGHPATKGSLDFYGPGQVRENVKGSEDWRIKVAEAVSADISARNLGGWHGAPRLTGPPTTDPVMVRCRFWLDPGRPDITEENRPAIWRGAGDVDKLARNVLDACAADAADAAKNGGAFQNDNQVVRLIVDKFSSGGRPGDSGLMLVIAHLTDEQRDTIRRLAEHARQVIQQPWAKVLPL